MQTAPKDRVLLVTGDAALISDVSHGLAVVGMELVTANGVEPACAQIESVPPKLVLTTLGFASQPEAALKLVESVRERFGDARPPIVALLTPEERALLGAQRTQFAGDIALPLVFPSFAHVMRRMMNELEILGN